MYLLSFDPAVPQSWYIPKRNNNRCPHKNWQMDVFSSIIHKGQSWKQLKYLSTDEPISKMWYIHAIEYYLEKAMAPHSSAFAWKIPWTEEPGELQSMGLLESDTTERLHFHFSLSCIGEGNGNTLQCSCLENPRDGGAWWAAVYGVAQSRTRLK